MIRFLDHPHPGFEAARADVGGKAASLWAMARLKLPVPPAFTVPITHAARIAADGLADADRATLREGMARLEREAGRAFGDLAVSVRSGAARSMPGMMDSVLGVADWPALEDAVVAVARSWDNPRARAYRERVGAPHDGGTAVTVQAMVFGDRDEHSATGVAFSRCPLTGEPGHRGEMLWRARGDAVVGGDHATLPHVALAERLPDAAAQLAAAIDALEGSYRDLVDVEWTVESGRLWVLQARPGKRSAAAAARIAVDLTEHPTIRLSRTEALARARDALSARVLTRAGGRPVAVGLPASPGLATGRVALSAEAAIDMADDAPVILVRAETSPEDVAGMGASAGVLTALGGPMSHAALVAREWGIPAVVGCEALRLLPGALAAGGARIAEGEVISIDGATGEVFEGAVAGEAVESPYAAMLKRWVGEAGSAEEAGSEEAA